MGFCAPYKPTATAAAIAILLNNECRDIRTLLSRTPWGKRMARSVDRFRVDFVRRRKMPSYSRRNRFTRGGIRDGKDTRSA
jgi:hypothetical protein